MKIHYRIIAEILNILHIGVLIMGLMLWSWWDDLLILYSVVFLFGMPSWIFTRRCFLTDIENYCRRKSGQDLGSIKDSFLGYWGKKIFGRHGPSNKVITWIVGLFYISMTPIWIYSLYLEYIVIQSL